MSSVNTSLSVKYDKTLKALPLRLYESIQLLASPCTIFATGLSSQAAYFIQTGGSSLSNTYGIQMYKVAKYLYDSGVYRYEPVY